jgi:hypothetical protein
MTRSGRAVVAAALWEGWRVMHSILRLCCNAYTAHDFYLSYWTEPNLPCVLLKMVRSKNMGSVCGLFNDSVSIAHQMAGSMQSLPDLT